MSKTRAKNETAFLAEVFLYHSSEGIVMLNSAGIVTGANQAAKKLLRMDQHAPSDHITRYLPELAVPENETTTYSGIIKNGNRTMHICSLPEEIAGKERKILLIKDVSESQSYRDKVERIKQYNKELKTIFECFAPTITITDHLGNITHAGVNVAKNCGVTREYLEGKNVADLEKEKIFTPSAALKVIQTGQKQVVMQTAPKTGVICMTVGIPVFDNNDRLSKVICIANNLTEIIKHMSNSDSNSISADNLKTPRTIFCSEKMYEIVNYAKRIAHVDSTILISGESGAGKEVLARYIHEISPRKEGPFVTVNCSAIPESLIESELFGYEPGSFTGARKEGKIGLLEAANHGTIFLDEVSEIPLHQQVKLLQVLQDKKLVRIGSTRETSLNIRFIAATNKNILEMVKLAKFREDLYYRLNVIPVSIPPLRERREDIPLLCQHFLHSFNKIYNRNKQITREALLTMMKYSWPGNVRELENTVERLVVTVETNLIELGDLPEFIRTPLLTEKKVIVNDIMPLKEAVVILEKEILSLAAEKYGSLSKSAKILGVDQSTVFRKMRRYSIEMKR